MAKLGLPPDLEPLVLELHGKGLSHRAIAIEASKGRDKPFAHATIGKFLRRVADERKPIAQAVAQAKLEKTVTSDLDELDAIRQRARAIEIAAMTSVPANPKTKTPAKHADPLTALRAQDQQRKVIETKLRFAGAGGDAGDLASLLSEAFAKP